WRHEPEPNVSPSVFIRLIEESGLICEFSSWLFAETFRLSEQWKSHLKQGCKVSINLSERQFLSDELMADLSVMPAKHGLQAAWFALEIREKALLANPERAAKLLESLSHDGFEIYLDNFGAGYSALMHLQTMPVHGIKIDRAFTAELAGNKQNERVAKALLNMADALELKVIAEGIESKGVSEWLLGHHCSFQQGYLYSEALEPDEVSGILATYNSLL
ncbi:MAG: EAL domain-containing protein, partial [Pseudomonadota bacterium]|nr:EAL domain-containing protein [Pseudomonadota bacterium]